MTFDEILAQVLDLLQREQRVSYRALSCLSSFNTATYPARRERGKALWRGVSVPHGAQQRVSGSRLYWR
jgi:hypothetical protein